MASIDEIVTGTDALIKKIEEAVSETETLATEAEETATAISSLGVSAAAEALTSVKAQLDELVATLNGAAQVAAQIRTFTQSVADGT